MQDAYIVASSRTAFAKSKKGAFRSMRSDDLAVQVLENLMQQVPQLNAENTTTIASNIRLLPNKSFHRKL